MPQAWSLVLMALKRVGVLGRVRLMVVMMAEWGMLAEWGMTEEWAMMGLIWELGGA